MDQGAKIIIIGAGLSGLALSYLLSKNDITATILEASSRIGGRIQTIHGVNKTPLELGATWFSDMHQNLIALLGDLGLQKFPQYYEGKSLFQDESIESAKEFYIPETEPPSYRVVGGTQSLINALKEKLEVGQIKLNTRIVSITEAENELILEAKNNEKFKADKVVLCVPPQLVGTSIGFTPDLSQDLMAVLSAVQTWMAGSIKFVLEYDYPFWRKNGFSGMLHSYKGIVSEMYDHTNHGENKFGFTGFLNGGAIGLTKEVRKKFVLSQLENLLGEAVARPTLYDEKIWNDEFILNGNEVIQIPHHNNGHPVLQKSYMNGKLYFSGTEASTRFSGYMEGAIHSAINVSREILS